MARAKNAQKKRAIRYTPAQLQELFQLMEAYIEEKDLPTLAGFIALPMIRHKFKITRTYIADNNDVFEHYTEAMKAKCEDFLVKKGLTGHATSMAIFMLKQGQYGGYADSQQLDLQSKGQPIKFINSVPRPKKA